jgi:hypothetical protein
MKSLSIKQFDVAFDFKKAMVENIEVNGLDNTMTQFRAIANSFAPDFYINTEIVNIHESEVTL